MKYNYNSSTDVKRLNDLASWSFVKGHSIDWSTLGQILRDLKKNNIKEVDYELSRGNYIFKIGPDTLTIPIRQGAPKLWETRNDDIKRILNVEVKQPEVEETSDEEVTDYVLLNTVRAEILRQMKDSIPNPEILQTLIHLRSELLKSES